MTKILLERFSNTHTIEVTFANTGCEHAETLEFVNNCDIHWGFNTVWVEAVVSSERGIGVRHKIVNYESASRKGEPFEQVIQKYGIPNATTPFCTARLKTDVIESYLRTKGFLRNSNLNYDTAIGIRADEIDRVSINMVKNRFVYPLVELGYTKEMVWKEINKLSWGLRLPEHLGNCTWCWKKTLRKHMTLALDNPEVFDFPLKMEEKYSDFKTDCAAGKDGKRMFLRKYIPIAKMLEMAKTEKFVKFTDPNLISANFDEKLDMGSGCEESCEVYPCDGS